MNPFLQKLIHHFEVGQGAQWVRATAVGLILVAFAAFYDYRQFHNLARPEAMDAAQLARSLARGEGFVTRCIRPLSIHALEQRALDQGLSGGDPAQLKGAHPDLVCPPMYPLALAAYMRCLPFDYTKKVTIASQVHTPDLRIAFFNQVLLILLAALTYGLGRSLFDPEVGVLAALAVAGSDLLWRWSISGLPNLLLAVWLTGLIWVLVVIERVSRTGQPGKPWTAAMGILTGLLAAAAGLTSYAALWLALPVAAFLAAVTPAGRRWLALLLALLAFLAPVAPWLTRNYSLSGNAFGIAGYSVFSGTRAFPEDTLERSLKPEPDASLLVTAQGKLVDGLAAAWRDLPGLGGTWIGALFLAGLLVRFSDPGRSRVRWLALAGLFILAIVQALTRTHLSDNAAGLTSENLTPALLPIVAVFGAALAVMLLDQLAWSENLARTLAVAGLAAVVALPLFLGLLLPVRSRLSHPPYYPPYTKEFGAWMKPDEVAMSDIPWAVAWYGDRKCVWLPRWVSEEGTDEDFYAVYDLRSPIAGLYLSPVTLESRFFSDVYRDYRLQKLRENQGSQRSDTNALVRSEARHRIGWGDLGMRALVDGNLPGGFPLKSGYSGYLNDGHLVLMDRKRWAESRGGAVGAAPISGPDAATSAKRAPEKPPAETAKHSE